MYRSCCHVSDLHLTSIQCKAHSGLINTSVPCVISRLVALLLTSRQTLSELSKILNKDNESTEDKRASSGVKYERNPAVCVVKARETQFYSLQIPQIYNIL